MSDAPITARAALLRRAERLITQDRNDRYGGPEDNFSAIAGHWTWWLRAKLRPGEEVSPWDVAQMMCGLKQARAMADPAGADHYADQLGYGAIAGELATGGLIDG